MLRDLLNRTDTLPSSVLRWIRKGMRYESMIFKCDPFVFGLKVKAVCLFDAPFICIHTDMCINEAFTIGIRSSSWYDRLTRVVRDKVVIAAGFGGFVLTPSNHRTPVNRAVIHALAERWWDTTHRFFISHAASSPYPPLSTLVPSQDSESAESESLLTSA